MIRTHYDPNLRKRLSCAYGDGIVLNPRFMQWEEHILTSTVSACSNVWAGNLTQRYGEKDVLAVLDDVINYRIGADVGLFEACRRHAEGYTSGRKLADNLVLFVHPLYMYLTNFHSTKARESGDEYWRRLSFVFRGGLSHLKVSRVLFDTLHHYAAATSLLVEEGLFDRVVFTTYDDGYPANGTSLSEFQAKRVFMAGGYNGLCFTEACEEIFGVLGSELDVWALGDIVICSPDHESPVLDPVHIFRKSLKPGSQEVVPKNYISFRRDRVITLEELAGRFEEFDITPPSKGDF